MEKIQYPQEVCEEEIKRQILALERTAWKTEREEESFPSAPETYETSFVLMEHGRAVCHVGIRRSALTHKGQEYQAYGLSEVVTHPDWRKRGLATALIREAAGYIAAQEPDLSIFTCERSRTAFYERGGWREAPGVCLVGGTPEQPFRSDSLGLVTMIRLISPRAQLHGTDFENTDVVFCLGEGNLW